MALTTGVGAYQVAVYTRDKGTACTYHYGRDVDGNDCINYYFRRHEWDWKVSFKPLKTSKCNSKAVSSKVWPDKITAICDHTACITHNISLTRVEASGWINQDQWTTVRNAIRRKGPNTTVPSEVEEAMQKTEGLLERILNYITKWLSGPSNIPVIIPTDAPVEEENECIVNIGARA